MKIGQIIGLSVLGIALNVTMAPGAYADGGDATLIHGCIAKDGTTRIVTPATSCKSSETARHWPTDARIIADETRITNTETKNTTQDSQISAIQTKNAQQDAAIATLQGQGGGASGGLVIKDSLGQVVGKYFELNTVLRQIENKLYIFNVTQAGFVFGGMQFLYTTDNCTGTPYIDTTPPGSWFEYIQSTDGQTGYLATQPWQLLNLNSVKEFSTGENTSGPGQCFTFPFERVVGTPITLNLNLGGLLPPFHLE